MPINPENLAKLDKLESTLREQLLRVSNTGIQHIIDTVNNLRTFQQFIIGLSAGTVGIIFPLLMQIRELRSQEFFLVSLFLFCYVIIHGFFHLVLPLINEVIYLPKVSENHAAKIVEIIKELREIRKIEDNYQAGFKLKALNEKFSNEKIIVEESSLKRFWFRYETLIFFAS